VDSAYPGKWEDFSRIVDGDSIRIECITVNLTQVDIPQQGNFSVIADEIILRGEITCALSSVILIARNIICDDVILNISGSDAVARLDRAQDGGAAGAAGADGVKGDSGRAAGSITIFCQNFNGSLRILANGGNGAKGQDGGWGATGETGAVGSDCDEDHPPGKGGTGGQGGMAGLGGAGGEGGDCGTVVISIQNGTTPYAQCLGGSGGESGENGRHGAPGPGGAPGNNYCEFPCWVIDHEDICHHTYQPAETGDQLAARPPLEKSHALPKDGRSIPAAVPVFEFDNVAASLSLSQIAMILSRCELDFANGSYDNLKEKLNWVKKIAESRAAGKSFYLRNISLKKDIGIAPEPEQWNNIAASASLFINRLALGLDSSGFSPTYVGQINEDFLKNEIKDRLTTADIIEKSFNSYLLSAENLNDKTVALKNCLTRITPIILGKQKQIEDLSNAANQTQNTISLLISQQQLLQQKIQDADIKFKNAVNEMLGRGCHIDASVKFIAGVIAIGAGVYGAYVAAEKIISGIEAVNADVTTDFVKDVKILSNTFKD
jgi:hypothetical protein